MQLLDKNIQFVHLTDSESINKTGMQDFYWTTPMRHKNHAFSPVGFLYSYLEGMYLSAKLVRKYKPQAVIGFGPGICIPAFMVCKLLNVKKRIFFEDWCRFSSKSLSGKACKPFSTKFFVQNESLKELYPNAEFAGRL
ncbi:PssD/Cps14F family polysaccharide biosynthesis glycosyltransferase [Thiothrix nivea]|uniref:PssD/Cps14F family polysaccharide biosynthesis glycosyltransferase n=1 Tax=Thiothrix nivea TaxID=1031 RepID=UPI001FE1E113|nr:PssD/Cps14F family polysaccharide biosynthesis glycosyltransferase [Thiothrix nivea]